MITALLLSLPSFCAHISCSLVSANTVLQLPKLHQAWKPLSGLETYRLGTPVMRQTINSLNRPPSPLHSLQPHTRAQQSFPSRAFFPAAIAGFLQPIKASQGGVPRAGFQQETKPAVRDQPWGNCETCNGGVEGLPEAWMHPEQAGPVQY